jgi:hypothetical protein
VTDIRTRLADALRKHLLVPKAPAFRAWDVDGLVDALLSLPGIAIVELPEPDSTRYDGDDHEPQDRLCWLPGDDFEVSVWNPGEVQRCGFGWGDFEPLSVAEARTTAVSLLAAANAAEAVVEVPSPPDTGEAPWPGDAVMDAWR